MESLKSYIFGKKSVPIIDVITEETREGLNKAYIPKFLYKPPFGYPRYSNLDYVRYLAQTPYVEMCIDTILQKLCSFERDIVPNPDIPEEVFKNKDGKFKEDVQFEILHQKNFLENPNTNDEYFEDVFIRQPIRDVLEINSGIINKVFNYKGELVECVARDGATFTKNPDIHGMFTDRIDVIIPKKIVENMSEVVNPFQHISAPIVSQNAAYFQYGWISGPVPVPFGRKEIVWFQKMKRTDDIYGFSAIQLLANTLQMLKYHIESDLEYYNDNNVPKGIIGLDAGSADEIKGFKEQWKEITQKKDEFGNWKKSVHNVPILNYIPKFERIEFSSEEMELIEKQKWYTKLVWASFGVTSTELGYTEDAKGTANQVVQSKIFKEKTVNPLLRMIETKINREILPEFEYIYPLKMGGKIINVPKYVFKFQTFDIDEEKSKVELYEKQIDSGIKTLNEIRVQEGDDPVEWGDEKPQKFRDQASNFTFGNPASYGKQANPDDEMNKNTTTPPKTNRPDENNKKVNTQTNNNKSMAKSEEIIDNSYAFVEQEQDLSETMKKLLSVNEKRILDVLKTENKPSIIGDIKGMSPEELDNIEIKGLPDIIAKIKSLLSFAGASVAVHKMIKSEFLNGAEEAENDINKIKAFNYSPNNDAIDFISNYTFENIKGMTDDIADNLRKELKMGLMNGEGSQKLTERVKSVFDVSERRSESIARTESSRAHAKGKLSAWQQSGIEARKWLLWTDDNRTSDITKALHAKYGSEDKSIPLDKNFTADIKIGKKMVHIDQDAPPFHINERDSLMISPVID